jgi:hypothetical protein
MCNHHYIITKLRTLLAELRDRESNLSSSPAECDCGCTESPQTEEDSRSEQIIADHRALCASIEGCDTTR